MSDDAVRVAKLIASRGLASRREAETWIAEGRVTLNGEVVTEPGTVVDPGRDAVKVDGKRLPDRPERVWYVLNKPRGCITGRDDPEGRKSVFDLLGDLGTRVEPVGRLDFDTEGALLLTNDGELAHQLTHPSHDVPKRYLAKVYRTPDQRDLDALEAGVFLEDGKTKPAKARVIEATDKENAWLEITVTEGKNRLVRRMLAQLGHPVSKLRRESFATISVRGLERGQYRRLTGEEIRRLEDVAAGRNPAKAGKGKKKAGFAKAKPKPARPGKARKKAGPKPTGPQGAPSGGRSGRGRS